MIRFSTKVRSLLMAGAVATLFAGVPAVAQNAPQTLDQLLQQVRRGSQEAAERNKQREAEFRAARDQQQAILAKAKAQLEAELGRSQQLEATFADGEIRLGELTGQLQERMGTLGELFGVVRQVAGDTRGVIQESLISGQLPGRAEPLDALAKSKELPSIQQLQDLWFLLQQEMTETGKVVKFPGTYVTTDGEQVQADLVRVGPFVAFTDGKYLRYESGQGIFVELARQPSDRLAAMTSTFMGTQSGYADVGIDPSRGQLLSLLIQEPTFLERVDQGGIVGYVILAIGAIGVLLALERIITLTITSAKVRGQMKSREIRKNNPLGRVLAVYEENRTADVETLELKLDEAILKEIPRLERGISTIKVFAAIAPLLGLLGTVTGMILTFQAITLFGTGDPKLMAGGISQALVTTVQGLVVAIPMVLLYSICNGRAKSVIEVLEEQSAGLIAQRADEEHIRDRAA
ncbi:MotA/TolQ/ExbB proton channel family protein [Indioceanicola profundi]|uniref:MotA/TolQ/ExbB proton channel family protein n=1 Tax=Indioceanicola profundi TaxID=2220096 RepID=UPI000E6ABE82|nr:MotA/TolQ/ExbB proton channel family protein [Indioceanicola profundi]